MDVIRKQTGNPGCDWKYKDSNKQIYLGASQNEHESDRMDGYSKEWLLTSAVQFLNSGNQPIWTCALIKTRQPKVVDGSWRLEAINLQSLNIKL